MRASLDTNVVIHFYRAGLQEILFSFFDEGVFIYEQIRNIELVNHGQDVLPEVISDIDAGKIKLYTNQMLKDFNAVNNASDLNWAFRSQLTKFIKRFFKDPYRDEDTRWIKKLAGENNINIKMKLTALSRLL